MESLYHSKKNAPLGKSHDQTPCLPEGLDPMVKSFGAKTVKGESAGPLVSPMKSAKEVEEEYNVKRELYKKVCSHRHWSTCGQSLSSPSFSPVESRSVGCG